MMLIALFWIELIKADPGLAYWAFVFALHTLSMPWDWARKLL